MKTSSQRSWKKAQLTQYCLALVFLIGRALAQTNSAALPNAQEPSATRRQIIVSIPDRKLALIEEGRVLQTYPVAVGAQDSPSPTGIFEIVNRLERPTYYHPHKVIPAGPDNPLGTRWIGLNKKGFGIHGTNEPRTIGHAASHGCIRMRQRDLEELFRRVRVGDEVQIHGERDEVTAQILGGAPASTVAANSSTTAELAGQF
jgi:lipoprotein-anchoring transpeptidase ErfK/SrfK